MRSSGSLLSDRFFVLFVSFVVFSIVAERESLGPYTSEIHLLGNAEDSPPVVGLAMHVDSFHFHHMGAGVESCRKLATPQMP